MIWSVFASFGAIFGALGSILQKEVLKKLHAVQLMTVSTLVVVLFAIPVSLFYDFSTSFKTLALISLLSVFNAFALIFSVRALRHLDISIVAPFFNLGTALTAILAFFLFREHLSGFDWIGIFFLILGGYLLELKSKNLLQPIKDVVKSESLHYLLGAVTLFSLGYLLAKFILTDIGAVPMFFYQQFFCLIIFVGITFFVYKRGFLDITEGFKKGKFLILVMALVIIIENIFVLKALETGDASLVIPLYRTWTLWAVILGGRLFHENHILKRALAALLMVLGAALILVW